MSVKEHRLSNFLNFDSVGKFGVDSLKLKTCVEPICLSSLCGRYAFSTLHVLLFPPHRLRICAKFLPYPNRKTILFRHFSSLVSNSRVTRKPYSALTSTP